MILMLQRQDIIGETITMIGRTRIVIFRFPQLLIDNPKIETKEHQSLCLYTLVYLEHIRNTSIYPVHFYFFMRTGILSIIQTFLPWRFLQFSSIPSYLLSSYCNTLYLSPRSNFSVMHINL